MSLLFPRLTAVLLRPTLLATVALIAGTVIPWDLSRFAAGSAHS
jgi:hypothetical protein